MKYEWKKQEKEIYNPKTNPELVIIPESNYICINGQGNPNNQDFKDRIQVLYQLSYAIKMMPKSNNMIENYFDYTVYPLEGLWNLTDAGKKQDVLNKEELLYTIMIKQPSFVTKQVFLKALEITKKKKPNSLLNELYYEKMVDGLSIQILHIGSYDDEPQSFNKLKEFAEINNLEINLVHREIYLSDSRKVEKEKQRTILRYRVKKNV